MNKQSQTSLLDFLMDAMPELGNMRIMVNPGSANNPTAQALYSMWSDMENKISDRKFVRPPKLSQGEVSKMESSGLVEIQGKYLKVTAKGANAIKEIILNTEKSSFEKSSSTETNTVSANTSVKVAHANIKVSKNWYSRQKES